VELIQEVIRRVGSKATFYVVDTAFKQDDGSPIVIELNDGQMSGLSANDPKVLYRSLKESLP
jgi:hypothetical protein